MKVVFVFKDGSRLKVEIEPSLKGKSPAGGKPNPIEFSVQGDIGKTADKWADDICEAGIIIETADGLDVYNLQSRCNVMGNAKDYKL